MRHEIINLYIVSILFSVYEQSQAPLFRRFTIYRPEARNIRVRISFIADFPDDSRIFYEAGLLLFTSLE